MDELIELITELLNHKDNHHYKGWTNRQITETWLKSHKHIIEPLLKQ